MKVTDRQREVLAAIQAHWDENGYAPTLRELGKALGIGSTNGVSDHLHTLMNKGLIAWEHSKARTVRVIGEST